MALLSTPLGDRPLTTDDGPLTTIKAIGVVGGMGPYAGADLVRTIFDETVARADQEHLPVVLISFPGEIPDRSTYLADPSAPSPVKPIVEILRRLGSAGCIVAGIPCNTAHAPAILDRIRDSLRGGGCAIDLVDIVSASAAAVRETAPGARRVGVLATPATIRTDVYGSPLRAAGLEVIVPDPDVQERTVTPAIFDREWGLKAQGHPPTEEARGRLIEAIEHLARHGAEAVILGCTELPLALPEPMAADLPLISSTRALARALIRASHPERLRPS